MDAERFDALTRSLSAPSGSRRRLLTGVAGLVLGSLAATLGLTPAEATHFGCRHVGERCKRDRQCCSSRCKGRTCQAHHTDTCVAAPADSGLCNNAATCANDNCFCATTTGGAGYCSNGSFGCVDPPCTTDRDCERATGIKGAACIECSPTSVCSTTGGRSCATPCPLL
jgi:hypothetical protein